MLTHGQNSLGMASNPMLALDPAAAPQETSFGPYPFLAQNLFEFLPSDDAVLQQVYGQADGSEADGLYAIIPLLLDADNSGGADYLTLQQIRAEFVQSNLYCDLVGSDRTKKQRFLNVLETMEQHSLRYQELFETLESNISTRVAVSALEATDERVRAEVILQGEPDSESQPNTFTPAVEPDSMRYLELVIAVFATKMADSPGPFGPCEAIAACIDGVYWKQGKTKKLRRVVEKALLNENRYDKIRDYARGSFIVDDDRMIVMASLVEHVTAEPAYRVIRTKNRFSRNYSAAESCGYRDYQLLVRLSDGWILEIQIIPRGVYDIKAKLGAETTTVGSNNLTGHDAYKEFRAIRGSRQRHHMAQPSSQRRLNPRDSGSSTESLKERFSKDHSIRTDAGHIELISAVLEYAMIDLLDPPPRDVVLDPLPPRPDGELRAPPSTVHVKSGRAGSVYNVPMDAGPSAAAPIYHGYSAAAGKHGFQPSVPEGYEPCDLGDPDYAVPTNPSDDIYCSPLPTPDVHPSSFPNLRQNEAAAAGAFSFAAAICAEFSPDAAPGSAEDVAPDTVQTYTNSNAPPPYTNIDDTFYPAAGIRPMPQFSMGSYSEAPYLYGARRRSSGHIGGVGRQSSDV